MRKLLLAALATFYCLPAYSGEVVTEYATEVFSSGGNKSRGYCVVSPSGNSLRARLVFLGLSDGSLSVTADESSKFISEYAASQKLNEKANGPGDLFHYNARISPRLGFSYHIDKTTNSRHYSVLGYLAKPDQVDIGDSDMTGNLTSLSNLDEKTFYLIIQALDGAFKKCPK